MVTQAPANALQEVVGDIPMHPELLVDMHLRCLDAQVKARPLRPRFGTFDVIVEGQVIAGARLGRQPADFHMSGSEHRFPLARS